MTYDGLVVLVIEDEPALGNAVRHILKSSGYRVELCKDHAEAGERAGSGDFSAAVIEYDLPNGLGLSLARKIKQRNPETPVIMIGSSYRAQDDISLQDKRHFDAFLSRPMWHYELSSLLETHLNGLKSDSQAHIPFTGELSKYPFESLLYQTFNLGFTGRLVLQRAGTRKVIYLLRGFPVFASSNTLTEALGKLLVDRGYITRKVLKQELDRVQQQEGRRTFGQHLVERRLISPHELREVLDEQVRERVLSCFELNDGEFHLFPGDAFAARYEHFVQNPIELVFLGVARFQETNQLAEQFQHRAQHHVVPTNKFQRLLPYVPLGRKRKKLLELLDGKRTVSDSLRLWQGDMAALFRFVWALQVARLVFFSRNPMPTQVKPIDEILIPWHHLRQFLTPLSEFAAAPESITGDIAVAASSEVRRMPSSSSIPVINFAPTTPNASPPPVPAKSAPRPHSPTVKRIIEISHKLDTLNHFELFGLPINAPPHDIRSKVERVLNLLEPTKVSKLPTQVIPIAARVYAALKSASAVLLDPTTREAYRNHLDPSSVASILAQGRALLKAKNYPAAAEAFQTAEAADPANPRAAALLARTLHLMHRTSDRRVLSQVQALLFRAVALDEAYPDPHFFLGEIEMDHYRPEQAKDHYIRALEIDPSFKPAKEALDVLGIEGPRTANIRASFLKSFTDDFSSSD